MQEKQHEEEKEHPLLEINHFYPLDWKKITEMWQDPNLPFEIRLSLLHYGFNVDSGGTLKERLFFYFDLADGFDRHDFSVGWHERHDPSNSDRRKEIAKKAFQMLCLHFFKDPEKGKRCLWKEYIAFDENVFKKMLWLFRPVGSGSPSLVNDVGYDSCRVGSHYLEIAQKFLDDFVKFVWYGFDEYESDRGHGVVRPTSTNYKWFIDARPQIVEILYGTRKLHKLLSLTKVAREIENTPEFDKKAVRGSGEDVLNKLRQLATKNYTRELSEAVVACDPAAEVLCVLNARKRAREQKELFA